MLSIEDGFKGYTGFERDPYEPGVWLLLFAKAGCSTQYVAVTPRINQCVSFRLRSSGAKRRFPIWSKILILNPSNIRNYGMSGMKKIKIGFVISIVVLFLGWLPKVGAGRVSWYLDNDFAHYYLTGGLVRSGINPYPVNLSPLYAEGGFTQTWDMSHGTAPPTLAVIMAPVSALPPFEAFCVWTAAQVVSLFLGVILLLRVCQVECSRRAVIFLLLGSLAPLGMFAHLRYGQTQALIFGLVAGGVVLVLRSRGVWWRSGMFLWGVSASFKLFTAPLGWVAFRYRGWEGLGWFALGFASLWSVFVWMCGWDSVVTFVTVTVPYLRELSIAFNGNISLSAALIYTQRVLVGADVVGASLVQLLSVLLVIPFIVWERREREDLVASTMMVLAVSCLLSPTAWAHYLPLLTGGFLYLLGQAQRSMRPEVGQVVTLALYVCMGVSMGYLSRGDLLTQIVSIWWGPVSMVALIALLGVARQRRGIFLR